MQTSKYLIQKYTQKPQRKYITKCDKANKYILTQVKLYIEMVHCLPDTSYCDPWYEVGSALFWFLTDRQTLLTEHCVCVFFLSLSW